MRTRLYKAILFQNYKYKYMIYINYKFPFYDRQVSVHTTFICKLLAMLLHNVIEIFLQTIPMII